MPEKKGDTKWTTFYSFRYSIIFVHTAGLQIHSTFREVLEVIRIVTEKYLSMILTLQEYQSFQLQKLPTKLVQTHNPIRILGFPSGSSSTTCVHLALLSSCRDKILQVISKKNQTCYDYKHA